MPSPQGQQNMLSKQSRCIIMVIFILEMDLKCTKCVHVSICDHVCVFMQACVIIYVCSCKHV